MNPGAKENLMLKGFNYPLTPKGTSTLNPPPPWCYSADFLYMVAAQEQPKYKRTSGVDFGSGDVVRYSEAFGALWSMVDAPDQIGPTLKKAFEIPGLILIGIRVDYRDNHRPFEKVR
jgi:hypothetical protein